MSDAVDVVVVGGGIAGASLAYALAAEGLGVTVLESSVEYQDRVRGECMMPWGVKEARQLGVEQVLLDAGAHVAPVWKQYAEGLGEGPPIPVSQMVDGIPGTLNLRHPDACGALVAAAADAGATVVRGVRDVKLGAGEPVSVTYSSPSACEVRARLIVGADGRMSTIRRQAAITLQHDPPVSYVAGLLVDGLDEIPDDHDVMAVEGNLLMLMFHQGGGRARLYLCPGVSGQHRFSGPDAARRFLASWQPECYQFSSLLASAVPAGPCATYPGDDTWTPTPFGDGVVLIGDAAGYNDPVIGQGLSIAMRDARIVRDLVLDGARLSSDFSPYGTDRSERMRRLRLIADVIAVTDVEDAENRPARLAFMGERTATPDGELFPLFAGVFAGPETAPDQLFDPAILERIRKA